MVTMERNCVPQLGAQGCFPGSQSFSSHSLGMRVHLALRVHFADIVLQAIAMHRTVHRSVPEKRSRNDKCALY